MVDYSTMDLFTQFHNFFIDICKEKKLHFIRVRPPLFHSEEEIERFTKLGYVKAPMYFQAEHTYRIDLDQDIGVLRKNMKKNTRYYVNKAEENAEIAVTITSSPDVIGSFFDLYQKTVERQHFVPYNKKFFEDEYEVFAGDDNVEFVMARYKEELVSAAMIVYYADTAYYHHGGSVRREPDSYASYLVQWEAIKRAKQKGMKIYDFFGIAPTDDPDHPRAGLTKFKRGFGGQRVRFLHTLDYPTNPFRYWPMYLYAKLERKRRGL
jgi:lipid II:glycine glycyltransferase (peptidoglycan interpeptide bridge formation enzyme)